MFLGQYQVEVGEDHTFILPERFARALSETAFLTQGFERNLLILTETSFMDLYNRITSMSISNPQARLLLRMLLGNATRLEQEKGKIHIPKQLLEFVELEKDGVVVGQGEYFEIWSYSLWQQQVAELNDVVSNAHRFSSLNLSIESY